MKNMNTLSCKDSNRQNKLAVITGAASGIGLALSKACILDGMDVVMADIAESALNHQIKQLSVSTHTQVVGIVCDVSKEEDVAQLARQTVERFNRVDLLINNAGIMGHLAPIWELSSKDIRHVLDVNLHGVLHCVQSFLPFMLKQQHHSHIVNMASLYGLCSGSQMAAYAMSKHAIVALSESLYFDLNRLKKPVDISVVCPSFTDTNLLQNLDSDDATGLHHMIGQLMTHSRSADDVAAYILREVKNKNFYILPDQEVKRYCEQRTKAIIEQTMPHKHNLEKIIVSLSERVSARASK